jgi:hypothetical protein
MLKRNSRHFGIAVLLLSLPVLASPLLTDGGGRREITPYQPNSQLTLAKVNNQKRIADSSMTLTSDGGQCANVGLAYAKNGSIQGRVAHSLTGTTDDGAKASIDFSVVEKMSIVRKTESPTATKALFRISIFPSISPSELVNRRPTYSDLVAKYRKTYEVWVETKNSRGNLSFTSSPDGSASHSDLCGKIEDILTTSEKTLAYPDLKLGRHGWEGAGKGLWWAIPSVTGDAQYPYRRPAFKAANQKVAPKHRPEPT